MKTILSVLVLLSTSWAFAAKTYQVTGPVVEITDSKIIVEKGKDKWEIERTAATKVMGDLKVGDKVTIEYTMAADKIEVKDTKKKK
ncbi:hypothetical protein [Bdellovibrio bacteriovorus]|uniref:hypothetical protein n=1 Tax=Bdellovibrio TaxID=958 RepID=UPI0035A98E66